MSSINTYTIPDGWTVCDLKENAWNKNERSHWILRIKREKTRISYDHTCGPTSYEPIHGNRSLKKSKDIRILHHHSKMYTKSHMNPEFMDWRCGEMNHNEYPNIPVTDESISPEATESPERLD